MSRAAARLGPKPAPPAREFAYGPEDFRAIAALLESKAGIHLPAHKDQLVYSRLAKRLRALGLTSFAAYRAGLDGPDGGAEVVRMVNALTTNLTRFFREAHHFAHLHGHLARLAAARPKRRVRLWSAGCSTGPEAWSMALTLAGAAPDLARLDARILATDIDTDALAVAREGRYAEDDLADLPARHRARLVEAGPGALAPSAELRELVRFKPLNLIGPWPFRGPFDAIFCRNVAIYFAPQTQTRLFSRMRDVLAPDGFLYIGHSETLPQLADRFEFVGRTIYRPR
jgi:chemotaxis protein methyltransferase CheR